MKIKRFITYIIANVLTVTFFVMTADVIKNPARYDTVAKYHEALGNRETERI